MRKCCIVAGDMAKLVEVMGLVIFPDAWGLLPDTLFPNWVQKSSVIDLGESNNESLPKSPRFSRAEVMSSVLSQCPEAS